MPQNLHQLSLLLATPYENLNLLSDLVYNLEPFVLEEIYLKKLFKYKWQKKSNLSFKHLKFSYKFNVLERNSYLSKIKLDLKNTFIVETRKNNILSSYIDEYIIIEEYNKTSNKILVLINKEDNPLLYDSLIADKLDYSLSSIINNDKHFWINKIASIDSFFQIYTSTVDFYKTTNATRYASDFDTTKACIYAETFALNTNPKYKSFEKLGGDCTNFVSQILYAGGIKQDNKWKPYTNSWIRSEDLYSYMITKGLAAKLPGKDSLKKGCLIQFFTPKIGRFFHNGFITYELPNNDFLYCCHSYNKLNYPLSETFPNRYPTLRALKFN